MTCKNCGFKSAEKYCGNCTQEMDTHRLTLKHFISHDILHGLFHLDGKLPKTLAAIMMNPGKVANEYIAGKRKKYYSFFYLLLLLIGLYLFLENLVYAETGEKLESVGTFLENHFKLLLFLFIPFIATVAWLFFRRLQYNYIEFHVLGVVILIGFMVIRVFDIILYSLFKIFEFHESALYSGLETAIVAIALIAYPLYALYTFVKHKYTFAGRIWRIFMAWFCGIFVFLALSFLEHAIDTSNKMGIPLKDYIFSSKKERMRLKKQYEQDSKIENLN